MNGTNIKNKLKGDMKMININIEFDNKEFIYGDFKKANAHIHKLLLYDTPEYDELSEGEIYILEQIRDKLDEKIAEINLELMRNFPRGLQPVEGSYFNPVKTTQEDIDNNIAPF